jgi:hypothetical protein
MPRWPVGNPTHDHRRPMPALQDVKVGPLPTLTRVNGDKDKAGEWKKIEEREWEMK